MAAHLEIDDVIDPAETRARVLHAFRSAPAPAPRTGTEAPRHRPRGDRRQRARAVRFVTCSHSRGTRTGEHRMAHDLVIRGGRVVDGTGARGPHRRRRHRRRAHHRRRRRSTAPAPREIDADGAVVAPGWVDVHSHYDGQATWDEELAPSSWHGVTTLVMGNCGVGFAPARPDQPRLADRPHGGRRGHPRLRAGRGHHLGVGELPRVPRRARAQAVDHRPRHPDRPRRGAGLRDGGARRPQRAGRRRRHRARWPPSSRRPSRPAPSGSPPAAPSPTAPSTASPSPAPSPPRTSCSASARCWASSAPACSSWRPPARPARTSSPR